MLSSGADGWAHSAVRTAGIRAAPAPSSGMHIAHIVKVSVPRSRYSNGDARSRRSRCASGSICAAAAWQRLAARPSLPLNRCAPPRASRTGRGQPPTPWFCTAASRPARHPPRRPARRAAGRQLPAAAAVESVLSSGLCAASLAAADAAPLGGRALLRRCGLLTPRRRASPGAARPGAHRALHRASARKIAQRRSGSVRRRCTCGPDQNLQLAAGLE